MIHNKIELTVWGGTEMKHSYALNDEEVELVRNYRRMESEHRVMMLDLSRNLTVYPPLPERISSSPKIALVGSCST